MTQRLDVAYYYSAPFWGMGEDGFPLSIFGVTRFGQSGNPDDLYREYEIDSDSIMAASFTALGI